ncbi:hypothetical protein [Terricaulis sp.]|uniref:hypothetical protein n=1 Tax=Terricaulis sp. TaxID=2768686 RepID=UPI0037846866
MANNKVPQAYRPPDPGQLVMVSDQSTVASTQGGARMASIGVIIGGAFIAAACLWIVNATLEFNVQKMAQRNEQLEQRVALARQQVQVLRQRESFFAGQTPRIREQNTRLQAELRRPDPDRRRTTPQAPRRSIPPPP